MTPHPNETPEPLAGPSVESCATALAEALRREKGWLLDYADSVIRDAIDREHLEPLAQEQVGEMPVVAWMKVSKKHAPRMCMLSEAYVQGVWDIELVRLSDATAAIQSKDAEIAGLKADAGRYRWLREEHEARDSGETFCVFEPDHGLYCLSPVGSMPGDLDAAIDAARKGEAA